MIYGLQIYENIEYYLKIGNVNHTALRYHFFPVRYTKKA